MSFDLTVALDSNIDTLNDLVHVQESTDTECANELKASVYASQIINGTCEQSDIPFWARMFFKKYEELNYKPTLMKIIHQRINYLISSPHSDGGLLVNH